ncbi:MAG: NAD(P)H-dependent oxidoreductase [Spirochaetia bacterium]
MKPMIVLCHPFERSFCHAIAASVREGFSTAGGGTADAVFHDLYAENPDPLLTGAEIARRFSLDEQIQTYTRELVAGDLLVIVHPDWWSAPPALLKGWLERVFRPGVAYDWQGEEFAEKHHVPLLRDKRLAVFVTSDRLPDDPPFPIEGFWRDVATYSGLTLDHYILYPDLHHSGHRQRRSWLRDAATRAKEMVQND